MCSLLLAAACVTCACTNLESRRQQVELCWLTNALLALVLALVAIDEFVIGEIIPAPALRQGFLLLFMLAAGPLAWSIAVLGNAFVFHSIDQTATLFIHAGPLITFWAVIGAGPDVVSASYPAIGAMLIGLETSPPDVRSELLLPAVVYYMLWWAPYTVWLMCTLHEGKSHEVLSAPPSKALKSRVHAVIGCMTYSETRSVMLVYCLVHLASCMATFGFALLIFHSYALFTIFLFTMLLIAGWNGASRYNYYLMDVYAKRLETALQQGSRDSSGGDAKTMV